MSNTLVISQTKKMTLPQATGEMYLYALRSGLCFPDGVILLNDEDRLNSLAIELKSEYSDYVYSHNNDFIAAGATCNNLSLFFISDFSNKRTEFFDTFASICHITLLKEKIATLDISRMYLCGCSDAFVESCRSVFTSIDIVEEGTRALSSGIGGQNQIASLKYFAASFLKVVCLKMLWTQPIYDALQRVFFTLYPMLLGDDAQENKYGSFVSEDDTYLVSVLTDGMIQDQSVFEYARLLRKLKSVQALRNIILFDAVLSLRDVITGYFRNNALLRIKKRLKKEYSFRSITISAFVHHELDVSFKRIPRLLMYVRGAKKMFSQWSARECCYYLHEFSYGRFLTYLLQTYSQATRTTGFQHGPASQRRLLYALSKSEVNQEKDPMRYVPLPDRVLCEDAVSQQVYCDSGYQNVEIMDDVYRLHYLKGIDRSEVIPGTILIACGLHDGESLFDSLLDEIRDNQQSTYYFRFHPKAENDEIVHKITESRCSNIVIADKLLTDYFAFIEEVVCTYSSVGHEAKKLGIRTRMISLPERINESPLLDLLEMEG